MSSSQIHNKFESITTTNPNKKYDVYLSFCDQDTASSFISHLYNALTLEAEAVVFWDNQRFCLQELDKIIECCGTTDGLIVVPLFYDGLYPGYGTLHRGLYGEGFRDFVHRMSIEDTSKEEDKFMTWVAGNSKATT
ncbi:NBS-containing resistance-like protein, partial [Trifolium medium]|nr:NBS-containing resistance-like protein [Trifolium medium]